MFQADHQLHLENQKQLKQSKNPILQHVKGFGILWRNMDSKAVLPTINLSSKALKPATGFWVSACNDVRMALEEYGCFVAVYDDFALEHHNKVFDVLDGLFSLPMETKAKNTSTKPFHGYSKPQYPLHLVESLGIEDAQDPKKTWSFTNLMWPSGNKEFCQAIDVFSKVGSQLEQLVKRMVFESYGVEKYLQALNQSTTYLLRVARYRGPKEDESNIGSVPHSDKSFLTVLHQNEVDGLEVQTKDGQWISYESTPQSFVVMAGEAFLAWSNNRVQAPIHRVVMNGERIRYSLGLFSFMNDKIATPEELIDEEHPMQFEPFDHYGLLHFYCREESQLSEFTLKDYCGV